MDDTLAALYAAIIDAPADRTVRLVYADALDESGAPSDAARAAFIRAQIALESMADIDPAREPLTARCRELFAANWIDWWRPICAAVGLPEPYVPGRGLGARLKRLVGRDKRTVGAPYTPHPLACSIHPDQYGFTVQFIGGFPEMLYIHHHALDTINGLGQWFAAAPFGRLRLAWGLGEYEWGTLDGPYLTKVTELVFDALTPDMAVIVARSLHLKGLTSLKMLPLNPAADVVRMLVHKPAWAGLHSLTLSGISTPEAIGALAEHCTLEQLEELTFGVGDVPQLPAIPPVGGPVGYMLAEVWEQVYAGRPLSPGPIRWPDYWPALLALARSPVVPRLKRLRIIDANPVGAEIGEINQLLGGSVDPNVILSDECVLAVAEVLDPHKLERLELPAARLTPACRAELARRFGPRFVPV